MDNQNKEKYQAVIGLEVHIQLLTKSKLFSTDANRYGDEANTNISLVTLAHPGTLPKLNGKALELAVKMGLACGSQISRYLIFDRKNYFYPDLPKGFQLTQDRTPICLGGYIEITTADGSRRIELNRIHLEEDAGKSFHHKEQGHSLIDFNRAGTPLIELVTEPVLHHPEEAFQLLYEIRKIVTRLGICDGNMEEGSLRCDANVSVKLKGSSVIGTKVEIKNMNSMRFVRKAISYEIKRQIEILEKGGKVESQTRSFNEKSGTTSRMRTKEELNDYRYFPEPDLSPVVLDEKWVQKLQSEMPELPNQVREKLMAQYSFTREEASFLSDSLETHVYFVEALAICGDHQSILNWLKGPLQSLVKEHNVGLKDMGLRPEKLCQLIKLVASNKLSYSMAVQKLLPKMVEYPDISPWQLASKEKLLLESDNGELEKHVLHIMEENPSKVEAYKKGKKGLLGFFMGRLMQITGGKADPKRANELFSKYLD